MFCMVLWWATVLCLLVSSVSFDLYEGDPCTTVRGENGTCSLFKSCASALQDFEQGLQSYRCGFQGFDEVVCCKDGLPKLSKSEEACLNYAKELPLRVTLDIVGGSEANIGEFPHMVALGYLSDKSPRISWLCGGTLITDRYILTAAHCITATTKKLTRVHLGGVDLRKSDDNSEDRSIERIIIHPYYRDHYNDIAIVKLALPVKFTNNILPACLYTKKDVPQTEFIVTGWGATNQFGLGMSDLLMKTEVKFMPLDQCNLSYAKYIHTLVNGVSMDMICALDPQDNKDTCTGDSGGPLQIIAPSAGKQVYYVVGVTSLGPKPCGVRMPSVYTKVASFVPWIENIVWS